MKGLILKDLYNMKGMVKSLVFLVVVFSMAFKDQGVATLIVMFTVTSTVLIINSLAMDEIHNWYRFAFTLPVTRHQLVLAKYIVSAFYSIGALFAGVAISFIMQVAGWFPKENPVVAVAAAVVAFLMALLFISLLLPVNLKFGVQKARLLLFALVAVPVLAATVIASVGIAIPSLMFFDTLSPYVIVCGTLVVVAAIVTCSYFISVGILKKKEF